jgi:multiple sugar transport system ATP-binding protein
MRAEITGLHHRLNATMIYVTHDQVEALTMGTKIVVMKDGVVQQIGAPLYLYSHPINKFVAGFIGSPPMNFLTVTVKEEGGKIIVDEGNFQLVPTAEQGAKLKAYTGKEVFLGIRPEDLEYTKTPDSANNVQATVKIIEPLGSETVLHVATKNQEFVARSTVEKVFQMDSTVNFAPVMDKAKFFDKTTELNICEDVVSE